MAEIRSMREDHELAVNALKVTHQLSVQSLTDELETKLASGLPPSSCDSSLTGGFAAECPVGRRYRLIAEGMLGLRNARVSVCLSICLSRRSTAAAVRGGFAAERTVGRRH